MLSPFEKFFLKKLSDLSVTKIDIDVKNEKFDVSHVEENQELRNAAQKAYKCLQYH